MSNIIIHKDRWAEKPKYLKIKSSKIKKNNDSLNLLISEGYTHEEAEKIISKKIKEYEKEQKLKIKEEISSFVEKDLSYLNNEQKEKLVNSLLKEYKYQTIPKIKKHLNKLLKTIDKDSLTKTYKKKDFQSVKDLRTGNYKIVKKKSK